MMSTRRAFLSAGGASAIALSLAACSRSQTKTAETLASGTPIAEPVLNDKQLAEILQRVQTGLAAADKEKNADKLKEIMSSADVCTIIRRGQYMGTVDVADIYSSDPAIGVKDLVILSDPQMLILPQNVTPLVSASLPAIAATAINRVSALLTPDELRSLNQRSTGEKLSSKVIATDWLTSKKLL